MKSAASKLFSLIALFMLAIVASVALAVQHGFPTGITAFFIADAMIASLAVSMFQLRESRLFSATLIVPLLTGKVMEAFKAKVPALDFFSTDFGKSDGAFAQPAKFGQEVISQLASVPTVARTSPGGLLTTSQSSTDLVSDLKVKIDRMASVKVRLPSADIQQLMAMPAFLQSLQEAGQALGRFVVADAAGEAVSGRNFTHSITAANPDVDTLEAQREQLNTQLALTPRFGIATTSFLGKISGDPRVMLQYGFNQRIGNDPYASFKNLYGLDVLQEMPTLPTGNGALGTFSAATTDICTIASLAIGIDPTISFYNGARVRLTSTGTLPAGLALATDYYIRDYTPDVTNGVLNGSGVSGTFKLAATLGGVAIDITDTGTGTHTITQAENLQAIFFEKRAIHIASRQMIDPSEAAQQFGIPSAILVRKEVDPITGLSFLVFLWQDTAGATPSLDVFATFVVQYGIRAGRSIAGSADPTSYAADSGMDRAGLRCLTA